MTSRFVLIFDLDDTLFEELDYVRSGLQATAGFLARDMSLDARTLFRDMKRACEYSRSGIFDTVLKRHGIYSASLVKKCVAFYRQHRPQVQLYPEAEDCLSRFKETPKYIITDGNQYVQTRKIQALGLDKKVKAYFPTYRFGVRHRKPSPYCFNKVCQLEKIESQRVFYIGDNVRKDFVGLRPLGYKTVRVLTGQHRSVHSPSEYAAMVSIHSLDGLTDELIAKCLQTEDSLSLIKSGSRRP